MTPEARQRQRVRFPVLALTAGAWVALLVVGMPHPSAGESQVGAASLTTAAALVPDVGSASHLHAAGGLGLDPASSGVIVAGAALMLIAMMAPLLIPALRHVIDRSLPSRRGRAVALLILGYAGTWAAVWSALVVAVSGLHRALGASLAFVAGLLVVAVWQASPAKQRSLHRCACRPALAAFGRAADADVLRFGVRQGGWCVGSCWALMLLPLLTPAHHPLVMATVAAWAWAERLEAPSSPGWRVRVPLRWIRIGAAQARARGRLTAGLRSRA